MKLPRTRGLASAIFVSALACLLTASQERAFAQSTTLAAEPDLSSPKSAARSFYAAIGRSDPAALKRTIVVQSDSTDEPLADAYANLILAAKKLGEAAKAKFPGSGGAFAAGVPTEKSLKAIESASVKLEDENSVTILPAQSGGKDAAAAEPIKLRRVGQSWKVLVGETSDTNDTAPLNKPSAAQRLALLRPLADAMNTSAEEIAAGKYATATEAESVVKERMGSVLARAMQMSDQAKPATQPATLPIPH